MKTLLLIALGGALGALARHGVSLCIGRGMGAGFPWGTLLINVSGSLAIGVIIGLLAFMTDWSQDVRLFAVVGFLGAFTTFSAFSLDAILLLQRGQIGLMGLYVFLSVTLSLLATVAGLYLTKAFAA